MNHPWLMAVGRAIDELALWLQCSIGRCLPSVAMVKLLLLLLLPPSPQTQSSADGQDKHAPDQRCTVHLDETALLYSLSIVAPLLYLHGHFHSAN